MPNSSISRPESSDNQYSRLGDVLFGADRQVSEWIVERIPYLKPSENARALGVVKNGKLVAGVMYENWNGVHVEVAIAVEPRVIWANKRTLHALFYYPFVTLGCKAVSVSAGATNLPSINLATKLGFQMEAIVKFAAHDGSDLIVLKMFRQNCKWILNDGQEEQQRTSGT